MIILFAIHFFTSYGSVLLNLFFSRKKGLFFRIERHIRQNRDGRRLFSKRIYFRNGPLIFFLNDHLGSLSE